MAIALFPLERADTQGAMSDVLQPMVRLRYTRRLEVDQTFFDTSGKSFDVMSQT